MKTITLFRLSKIKCFFLCILMYALSLSMNGIYEDKNGDAISGLTILLLGWLGIFDGVLAWYANPCLLLSLVLLFKIPTVSRWMALAGFLMGATALGIRQMAVDESGSQVAVTLGAAYYLWWACFLIAFLAAVGGHGGDD